MSNDIDAPPPPPAAEPPATPASAIAGQALQGSPAASENKHGSRRMGDDPSPEKAEELVEQHHRAEGTSVRLAGNGHDDELGAESGTPAPAQPAPPPGTDPPHQRRHGAAASQPRTGTPPHGENPNGDTARNSQRHTLADNYRDIGYSRRQDNDDGIEPSQARVNQGQSERGETTPDIQQQLSRLRRLLADEPLPPGWRNNHPSDQPPEDGGYGQAPMTAGPETSHAPRTAGSNPRLSQAAGQIVGQPDGMASYHPDGSLLEPSSSSCTPRS